MKASRNFSYKELVPPDIWREFGSSSRWFVDQEAVKALQWVRDKVKAPVFVNNWPLGGDNTLRGYRPPTTEVGAFYSQHKFGRAFDISSGAIDAEELYEMIRENEQEALSMGITTLEDISYTESWVHFDVRDTGGRNSLLIIEP